MAADALVLKHQAISSHNTNWLIIHCTNLKGHSDLLISLWIGNKPLPKPLMTQLSYVYIYIYEYQAHLG